MKKATTLFILFAVLTLLLSVTACRRVADGVSPSTDSANSSTPSAINPRRVLGPDSQWSENLASSAILSANSSNPDHGPNFANDGNLTTFWSSTYPEFYPLGHPLRENPYNYEWGGLSIDMAWPSPQRITHILTHLGPFQTNGVSEVTGQYFDSTNSQWVPLTPISITLMGDESGNNIYDMLLPSPVQMNALRLFFYGRMAWNLARVMEIEAHEFFQSSLVIRSPTNNSSFQSNTSISLQASTKIIRQFGPITGITWVSSKDGIITSNVPLKWLGNGFDEPYPVSVSTLTSGIHTITVQGIDYRGLPVISNPVTITVEGPLKITSPATNGQFMVGENIQFTSSASTSLHQYQWFADNVVFGNTPGQPSNSASYLSPGTHTIKVVAQKVSDGSQVSDSIDIKVLAGFRIKILDSGGSNASVRTHMHSVKA